MDTLPDDIIERIFGHLVDQEKSFWGSVLLLVKRWLADIPCSLAGNVVRHLKASYKYSFASLPWLGWGEGLLCILIDNVLIEWSLAYVWFVKTQIKICTYPKLRNILKLDEQKILKISKVENPFFKKVISW